MTRSRRTRNETRPRVDVERTPLDRAMQVVGAAALLLALWVLVAGWAELPETVPVHFGFTGEPDAWGPRSTLILLYVLGLAMYIAFGFAERIPHTFNYPTSITEENAGRQYALGVELLAVTKAWIAVLFLQILRIIVALATGEPMESPMTSVLLLGLAYAAYLTAYFFRARKAR